MFSILLSLSLTASALAGGGFTGYLIDVTGSFVSEVTNGAPSVKTLSNPTLLKLSGASAPVSDYGLALVVHSPGELSLVSFVKSTKAVEKIIAIIEQDMSIEAGLTVHFHGDSHAEARPSATKIIMAGAGGFKLTRENLATCIGSISVSSVLFNGNSSVPRAILNLKFKATGAKVNNLTID